MVRMTFSAFEFSLSLCIWMSKGNADFSCPGEDNRDKTPRPSNAGERGADKFKIPQSPGQPPGKTQAPVILSEAKNLSLFLSYC